MILSENQSYQIGPQRYAVVQNLLRDEHRGHAVYVLRAIDNEARVVCKIATNEIAAKQMAHEQDILQRLIDVPGVVRSLGLHPFDDHCAMLLEYIDAPHVARGRLHVTARPEHRALTWPIVVALMQQGVDILAQAHQRNIIHADVKLQNFLYTTAGQVYLIDWDHSLLLPAQPNSHTPAEGTPQFMAPEQVRHEPVDQRTDLYSLGVSCLALLYGARLTPRYVVNNGSVLERTNRDIVKALRVNETIKFDLLPKPLTDTEAVLQSLWRTMAAAQPMARPPSLVELRAQLSSLPACPV
jgi:serine/threonine protein kinase